MENAIQNTAFANNPISPTNIGRAADGSLATSGTERYAAFRAGSAITKGQVVAFLAAGQTAGTPISVEPMATTAAPRSLVGIATNTVAAGGICFICVEGICDVYVPSTSPTAGQMVAIPTTTAGEAVGSATQDATTVAGSIVGVFLSGTKVNTNYLLAYVNKT